MEIFSLIAACVFLAVLKLGPLLIWPQRGNVSEKLSKRQTETLLRAWDEFDLGRNRPEPPRRTGGRGVMWDEWLDEDHTPRLPTAQRKPRGRPRGNSPH